MRASKLSENTIYYLALLDWREKILGPDDMKVFTKKIIPSPLSSTEVWTIGLLTLPDAEKEIDSAKIGYYHSRLILELKLKVLPKEIFGIREMRLALEKKVITHLEEKILPEMKKYTINPRIFIYPIVETKKQENFWKFETRKPYSMPTTCFYTELDDPRQGRLSWLLNSLLPKKVRMRVSGAKIITSEMSEWFYWNLVNIVFHEGLYRQSRVDDKVKGSGIYAGVENRLEDFASNLIDSFYSLSNARTQDLIAKFVLVLTIAGVIVAAVQFVLPLFPQLQVQAPTPTPNLPTATPSPTNVNQTATFILR